MDRKEAIEIIIKNYPHVSNSGSQFESALRELIPELKEDEDERIRERLIDLIRDLAIIKLPTLVSGYFVDGQNKKYIAYLEKQKENPKSADSIPSDCTSDAKYEDRWHKVGDFLPDNGKEVLAKDKLGNILLASYDGEGWDVSVYDDEDYRCHIGISKWCEIPSEKQKEQKPLPSIYWHAIKEGDTLPCRAYLWTTNYEKYYDCFEGRLIPNVENVTVGADMWYLPVEDIKNLPKEEDLDTVSPMKTVEQKPALRLVGDGLISDPNSHFELEGEQKPAEWSEEDEYFIKGLCDLLVSIAKNNYVGRYYAPDLVSKLQSLRPKPRWKPTTEHLSALSDVLEESKGNRLVVLKDLYKHIKEV